MSNLRRTVRSTPPALRIAVLGGALLLFGATAVSRWRGQDESPRSAPASAAARPVQGLIHAQPFVLRQGYTHWYRKERPTVDAGYLLVLEVDPDLAQPRQLAEPVLYVGDQTAERVNHGSPSGRLVVLVPAPRGADGLPVLELGASPIWYGAARLPEEVDQTIVLAERQAASLAGVGPLPPERVAAALDAGGGLLELADKTALERYAAGLVLRHAAGEEELARNLLR